MTEVRKRIDLPSEVCKVHEGLGLVFGWALVSKANGQDYWDLHGHNIVEDGVVADMLDFVEKGAIAKVMHEGDASGSIPFIFPFTTDIAKSLDLPTDKTGVLIAMKPTPEVLAKYKSGEYKGFSIGAIIEECEVVDG